MEYQVNFNYSARYCKLGKINARTNVVWFVLHGYGQLASYFIKKFQPLVDQHHCVIAPEGLNRFYLRGFNGRVGATWMTKEDRLRDIENYLNYLTSVYRTEIPNDRDLLINILGFSQGAATVCRWVTQTDINFNSLILWAGIFPPDLEPVVSREKLEKKKLAFVYGLKDPYLSSKILQEQDSLSKTLGVTPKTFTFDGVHDIDPEILNKLADHW